MEVSAQAIVARNKHYVGYGRDILDRFTNYIALLVGTHTMCQIRNTLITCTVW